MTRVWVGGNERSQLRSGEVEYRNRFLEITPSELYTDRRTVAVQFGGGGDDNLTRRAGAGGVITSTVDYVRLFAGAFDLACDVGLFSQATVDVMLAVPLVSPGANPCGFDTREVRGNGVVALGKNGQLGLVDAGDLPQRWRGDRGLRRQAELERQPRHAQQSGRRGDGLADARPVPELRPARVQLGVPAGPRRAESLALEPQRLRVRHRRRRAERRRPRQLRVALDHQPGLEHVGRRLVHHRQRRPHRGAPAAGSAAWQLPDHPAQRPSREPTDWRCPHPRDVSLPRRTGRELRAIRGDRSARFGFVDVGGPALLQRQQRAQRGDGDRQPRHRQPLRDARHLAGGDPVRPFHRLRALDAAAGRGAWYFQAAIADPTARDPLPMPVTNVRSVRAL